MQFLAIVALAFAAIATACKDKNIFCAPDMAPPSKRSIGFTIMARAFVAESVPVAVVVDVE
jgi:hypothetical protein